MSDLSPLGLTRTHEEEWRQFFQTGRVYAAPTDRARVQKRMRINTVVLSVAAAVVILALAGVGVAFVADFGRAVTYVLLVLLAIAAGFVFVKFWLTRRRLTAGVASGEDYLVVSAEGIRLAGHIDLPWSAVIGGVGYDGRESGGKRAAMRISRAAGVPEAEFVLGVRGVRALRDAAPAALRGVFEVIAHHGGIRIPLDTMVGPENVRASLAAISIAAHLAGVRADVVSDQSAIFQGTFAALGDPDKFDTAMP
jgi:hypothetical protein